ncbi:MAG: glutaredoxin family protein, partial [Clostridia bacterium]|nr:glutaredoxin family protein [Clostridia bacterium]
EADGYYLFTTKTCPNCPVAKANLDRAGIAYTVVDAEENAQLSDKYGIRQAPTLVIIKDGQVEKAAGVSAILAKIR